MNIYIIVFAIYCLLMIGIGIYINKRYTSYGDYMIGKDSGGVHWFPFAMSMMGTQLSGSTFLGNVGQVYVHGIGNLIYIQMAFFGAFTLSWVLFAKRMKILSTKIDLQTTNDYIEQRYESPKTRMVFSVLMIIMYIPYLGAQYLATALLLDRIFGVPYVIGLFVGGLVVGIYMSFGGYLADIWTDTFQGVWMVLCWFVIIPMIIIKVGGGSISGLFEAARGVNPGLVESWTGAQKFYTPKIGVGFILFATMASMVQPAQFFRFYSQRDWKTSKFGAFLCQGTTMWIHFCTLIVGLGAAVLMPGLGKQPGGVDYAALYMARDHLPSIAGAILLVGLMAAMMSTTDGILFVAATAFTRDIYERFLKKPSDDDKKLRRIGMWMTMVLTVLSLVLVLDPTARHMQGIMMLTYLSWGLLGILLFFPIVFGLFWKKMNTAACIAGSLSGVLVYFIFYPNIFFKGYVVWGLHPWIPAIILSFIATMLGVKFGKPNSEVVLKKFFDK